jgi:predicted DCC family thiol-disulfide oxidoreductase YuxK
MVDVSRAEATPSASAVLETGPLVLFDGVCNLCSALVRFLAPRDRDHLLWYVPMQSPVGQTLLRRHGLPLEGFDSFVLLEGGRVYLKSRAFFRVVRHMQFPWSALGVGRFVPGTLADFVYDRIAKNRYRLFGKRDVCMIPEKALATRFISDEPRLLPRTG